MQPGFDTRLAAHCVIVRDDCLLLSHWGLGDRWILPGGGIELGESPAEAAEREVLEETGLSVQVGRVLGFNQSVIGHEQRLHPSGDRPLHAVSVLFEATVVGGSLRPESDGSTDDAAWVPLADLAGLDLGVHVRTALELAGVNAKLI